MKRQIRPRGQEGFTLIEVIVSTVLLLIAVTGFMMMTAANAGILDREQRIDRSNYELGARAVAGEGEATGETLVVEFSLDSGEYDGYDHGEVSEVFDQYGISETGEDPVNSMTFYKHR